MPRQIHKCAHYCPCVVRYISMQAMCMKPCRSQLYTNIDSSLSPPNFCPPRALPQHRVIDTSKTHLQADPSRRSCRDLRPGTRPGCTHSSASATPPTPSYRLGWAMARAETQASDHRAFAPAAAVAGRVRPDPACLESQQRKDRLSNEASKQMLSDLLTHRSMSSAGCASGHCKRSAQTPRCCVIAGRRGSEWGKAIVSVIGDRR